MSVYCTVQEAWGQNFGRRQINNGNETMQNNTIEGFADIDPMPNSERIFTKSSARIYQPDDSYHHSSSKYRQFKAPNTNQQPQAKYLQNVPSSYETNSSQGSDYYDFEDNKCPLGGSRIRSTDVMSEPQLYDEMYPVYPGNAYSKKRVDCNPISAERESGKGKINVGCDQSLCDDVALHIMNCPTCQQSVTKIVEKFRSIDNNTKRSVKEKFGSGNEKRNSRGEYDNHDNDNDNEDDDLDESSLDVTEIILFIICGIFFVFLLDSIVSIGKRFR